MAFSYIEMYVDLTLETRVGNVSIKGDSNDLQTRAANIQNREIAVCDQGDDVEGQTLYIDKRDNPPPLVT